MDVSSYISKSITENPCGGLLLCEALKAFPSFENYHSYAIAKWAPFERRLAEILLQIQDEPAAFPFQLPSSALEEIEEEDECLSEWWDGEEDEYECIERPHNKYYEDKNGAAFNLYPEEAEEAEDEEGHGAAR
jgi:hypothetical protein